MATSSKNRLLRAAFSVTGVIALSKVFGLIKQMVVASHFGATIETDLINLAEGFIANVQYVLVQVLLTSFTSAYIHTRQKDETLARRFVGETVSIFSLLAVALSVIVFLSAHLIARVIAPSYPPSHAARLAGYLRLFCPVLTLYIWQAVSHSLLNANQRFIPGEMVGLNQSVILILAVVIFQRYLGVKVLVYSFILYTVFNSLFLVFSARRYISFSVGRPFADPAVRTLLRMAGPLFLSYAMVYINQQVDKILASGLPAGTVTAIGYAAVLSNLVGTFIVSFCSIIYTYITSHISKGEHRPAAERLIHSTSVLILIFLPISIITIRCSHDVVSVIFGRGAYTGESVKITAAALMGYGFSFVPLILREQFSRFQYGYQNSRAPMINSVISIFVNIALSIILCAHFGAFGITLASSVAVCVCGALNILSARKLNGSLSLRPFFRQLPILAAGGLVCFLIAGWALHAFQAYSPFPRFVLTALLAGGGYALAVSPLLYRLLKTSGKRSAVP